MPHKRIAIIVSILPVIVALTPPAAAQTLGRLTVDHAQVKTWNEFAAALYVLHQHQLENRAITTAARTGGYAAGALGGPDFYREVKYYDAQTGRLLSRIQWERKRPSRIHVIEVFVHGKDGRVVRDYLAAYLPRFRNAPVQTLINFHGYGQGLHSFRQFDASGRRIYEQCRGKYFGEDVFLSLDDPDSLRAADNPELFESPVYLACFENLPLRAGSYLDPRNEINDGW
jgi:hypothetical protein